MHCIQLINNATPYCIMEELIIRFQARTLYSRSKCSTHAHSCLRKHSIAHHSVAYQEFQRGDASKQVRYVSICKVGGGGGGGGGGCSALGPIRKVGACCFVWHTANTLIIHGYTYTRGDDVQAIGAPSLDTPLLTIKLNLSCPSTYTDHILNHMCCMS